MTSEANEEIVRVLDEKVTAPNTDNLQDECCYGKVSAGGADGRYEKVGEADG